MNNILHVHSPKSYHDPIIIVGDVEGMVTLRAALNQAINNQNYPDPKDHGKEQFTVFHADGEGSPIMVAVTYPARMEAFPLPYTDETVYESSSYDDERLTDLLREEGYVV